MLPLRGALKKKNNNSTTTTTTPQQRTPVVTIKEPSSSPPEQQQNQDVSPASTTSSSYQQIPPPQTQITTTSIDEYIKELKSTIAEQRHHLDVARFGLEKERTERQNQTARALEMEEVVEELKEQINETKQEVRNWRQIVEKQSKEIADLKQQLQQQITSSHLLSRAADEERSNAAKLRNAYDKMKENFEANERVFRELLSALRQKSIDEGCIYCQQREREKQSQNNTSIRVAAQTAVSEKEVEKIENFAAAAAPPAVWMSAWRQLQQRRHFSSTLNVNNNNKNEEI
jgi:hypothetical protein